VSEDLSRTVGAAFAPLPAPCCPCAGAAPVASPTAIERMNAMIGVLRRTGLDEQVTLSAYVALHTYTADFAALEASRVDRVPGRNEAGDLARQLTPYTTAPLFKAGLGYLLKGIGRQPGQNENLVWDPRDGHRDTAPLQGSYHVRSIGA